MTTEDFLLSKIASAMDLRPRPAYHQPMLDAGRADLLCAVLRGKVRLLRTCSWEQVGLGVVLHLRMSRLALLGGGVFHAIADRRAHELASVYLPGVPVIVSVVG